MARCPVWSSWALPPTCKHACNGGMAAIFGPHLRNNSDKDLSDCNSLPLFLLGDFLFPLVPADPGQRASERSWTRTTRQLCRVQRPPTLFSATSPLSHLSKAPNPEKRPTFCVASFSARQNDRHAVEKSVKRWNMSVESCPIVLVCVLSDWQDCQVPLTNHLLPFQIGRTLIKKWLGWKSLETSRSRMLRRFSPAVARLATRGMAR